MLGLYFGGTTWLGLWTMRKIKSSGDYFMGGRGFGKALMIAQAFGVGTHTDQPVSVSGAAYTNGLAGIWYQWVYMFSTPFFWLVAPIYRRLRYVTMADFFVERYGKGLAVLYIAIALLYFCMNIGLMLKGTGVTVEALTGGALSEFWVILIATVLFVSYGLAGGLVAAVYTDLIQGVLILILSFMLIPFALNAGGGFQAFQDNLPDFMFSLVAPSEVTLFFISMAVLNALVGVVVLPHHMAIGGSGKTEIACRTGWTFGNFLKRFATAGWAFIGVFAALLFPGLGHEERELAFGIAARELLPAGFVGLMLAAIIAAAMSTCDAFMVHASALFTNNLYKPYLRPKASERELLTMGRMLGLIVVVGGIVIAFALPSVVHGIKLVWQVTAFVGLSFWLGVIWRRANRWGALASVIGMAVIGFGTEHLLGWSFAERVALYLPVGAVLLIAVSLLTPPEPSRKLDDFYLLLDTPVGQEHRLHEAGVEIKLGASEQPGPGPGKAGQLKGGGGDGLLIVDLLRLPKVFSLSRYRIDLLGFLGAWLLAFATMGVVWAIATL